MKKVVVVLALMAMTISCTSESVQDQEELNKTEEVETPSNQIESVDGSKIKRPGSGSDD